MSGRDRQRKHAQRLAHQERRDHRQPDAKLTADQRRIARAELRREERPARPAPVRRFLFDARARRQNPALRAFLAPMHVRSTQPMPEMTSDEKRARRFVKRHRVEAIA